MAAKKPDTKKAETSRVVDVTVPAKPGIALNDIYKAALSSVRDEIPLVSNLYYDIDSTEKKGQERVYKVRISWGPRDDAPAETDPADGDFVGQHLDSLDVPTGLPAGVEGNPGA